MIEKTEPLTREDREEDRYLLVFDLQRRNLKCYCWFSSVVCTLCTGHDPIRLHALLLGGIIQGCTTSAIQSTFRFTVQYRGHQTEMAPRGGSRKVGLKRIDAAVDALLPLGFTKSLICKTIKDLLAVYDGDHGWPFIEEASYKLLIETILEKQEEKEKQLLHDKIEEETAKSLLPGKPKEETAIQLVQDEPQVDVLMNNEINDCIQRRRPHTFGWISDDEGEAHNICSTWISQDYRSKSHAKKHKSDEM